MSYILVRLGKHGFPCGASHYETRDQAIAAAESHAEGVGMRISHSIGPAEYTQLLTGPESLNSYLVIAEEYGDDEEHAFGEL